MAKKIAVALDGSEGAGKAFREAVRLTRLEKAELWVISIEELPRYPGAPSEVSEEKEVANHYLQTLHEEAATFANSEGVTLHTDIRIGHPARGLVDYISERGIDLLVLGHSGHSSLWGTFLGTTADKVVRHALCSVLVVR
jgi:nucleotide-binding universal stress UspA family protein